MKAKYHMSSLFIASALIGLPGPAEAAMQSDTDIGTEATSQQRSQQGVRLEGADTSILGGPEILFGRIERIEDSGLVVQGDRGRFMKLQLSKDTKVVCANGSQAKLHNPSLIDDQHKLLNDSTREHVEYESLASQDASTFKDAVGSTDETMNDEAMDKHAARESGFVVGSSGCHFTPGDLVRIEASEAGPMTIITRLPYEEEENGSQIATEKDEESNTSTQ